MPIIFIEPESDHSLLRALLHFDNSFRTCWQQLDASLQRDTEIKPIPNRKIAFIEGDFPVRNRLYLDPNEAKVSNFRDVVSLALPFEGETGEVAKIRAFLSFLGKDILKPFLRSITLQMF